MRAAIVFVAVGLPVDDPPHRKNFLIEDINPAVSDDIDLATQILFPHRIGQELTGNTRGIADVEDTRRTARSHGLVIG